MFFLRPSQLTPWSVNAAQYITLRFIVTIQRWISLVRCFEIVLLKITDWLFPVPFAQLGLSLQFDETYVLEEKCFTDKTQHE